MNESAASDARAPLFGTGERACVCVDLLQVRRFSAGVETGSPGSNNGSGKKSSLFGASKRAFISWLRPPRGAASPPCRTRKHAQTRANTRKQTRANTRNPTVDRSVRAKQIRRGATFFSFGAATRPSGGGRVHAANSSTHGRDFRWPPSRLKHPAPIKASNRPRPGLHPRQAFCPDVISPLTTSEKLKMELEDVSILLVSTGRVSAQNQDQASRGA